MVMVAANGDELRWAYEGIGSLPDAQGISELTGTFVITGGTGRFTDATGSGTFLGTGNTVTGVASDVLSRNHRVLDPPDERAATRFSQQRVRACGGGGA